MRSASRNTTPKFAIAIPGDYPNTRGHSQQRRIPVASPLQQMTPGLPDSLEFYGFSSPIIPDRTIPPQKCDR
ncbi:MAG TPA: hypothetical protein V6C90_08465 [Coleofasciculaceae cyanobacterium]